MLIYIVFWDHVVGVIDACINMLCCLCVCRYLFHCLKFGYNLCVLLYNGATHLSLSLFLQCLARHTQAQIAALAPTFSPCVGKSELSLSHTHTPLLVTKHTHAQTVGVSPRVFSLTAGFQYHTHTDTQGCKHLSLSLYDDVHHTQMYSIFLHLNFPCKIIEMIY